MHSAALWSSILPHYLQQVVFRFSGKQLVTSTSNSYTCIVGVVMSKSGETTFDVNVKLYVWCDALLLENKESHSTCWICLYKTFSTIFLPHNSKILTELFVFVKEQMVNFFKINFQPNHFLEQDDYKLANLTRKKQFNCKFPSNLKMFHK